MKSLVDSKPKIYALITVPIFVVIAAIATFTLSGHPPISRSPVQYISTSPTPSTSAAATSASDYPPSRFQAGRPSAVTGLKAASVDAFKKTVKLTWNPNPASENVDEYALYYYADSYLFPSGDRIGTLVAVVKTPYIISQVVGVRSAGPAGFQPYGANEIPTCNVPDINCALDQISVWVVAHNKNGWSYNDPTTPNPDENPANFSELSFSERNQSLAPQVLSADLSTLDPNFNSGDWPAYSTDTDINSLSMKASPSSQWTIPWLPEVDLPLSRFQPGRPSDVSDLRLATLDEKKKTLTLKWDKNRAEGVDDYAVYVRGTNCPDDFCYSTLVGTVKGDTFKASINFQDPNSTEPIPDVPGVVLAKKGRTYVFWVIVHNSKGWSNNDRFVSNPDQLETNFRYLTQNQQSQYPANLDTLTVNFP